MPTSEMPKHLTKVSYILRKKDKPKLLKAAQAAGLSMSEIITKALVRARILPSEEKRMDKIALKDPAVANGRGRAK